MRQVWRVAFHLRPGALLHYLLMLTYYPSVAIGWIMGILISACYLGFGVSSLRTDAHWLLTYYAGLAALQFLLYRFMRRHITSPHGRAGCSGLTAMLVSALTAPVYARSLLKVLFRRKLTFTVTAKGTATAKDTTAKDTVTAQDTATAQDTVTAKGTATDRLWTFRYSPGLGHRPGPHPGRRHHLPPPLPRHDRLDRRHPHRLPRPHRHLVVRPGGQRAQSSRMASARHQPRPGSRRQPSGPDSVA